MDYNAIQFINILLRRSIDVGSGSGSGVSKTSYEGENKDNKNDHEEDNEEGQCNERATGKEDTENNIDFHAFDFNNPHTILKLKSHQYFNGIIWGQLLESRVPVPTWTERKNPYGENCYENFTFSGLSGTRMEFEGARSVGEEDV